MVTAIVPVSAFPAALLARSQKEVFARKGGVTSSGPVASGTGLEVSPAFPSYH